MFSTVERVAESEPPSTCTIDKAPGDGRVDRMMAMARVPATAHVALIGRHTLPSLLALLRHGCAAVRCLRPGAPSPDQEIADLAWIVDVGGDEELAEALRAARCRVGATGRVVVEAASCVCRAGRSAIRDHAVAAGLDVVSFDHKDNRVVLAVAPRLAQAA
jgi:hypothetical protein